MDQTSQLKKATKKLPLTGMLIGVRLQPVDLEALDEWRRGKEVPPTRPEAIRQLMKAGLAALRNPSV
jgi:hypothetical protein